MNQLKTQFKQWLIRKLGGYTFPEVKLLVLEAESADAFLRHLNRAEAMPPLQWHKMRFIAIAEGKKRAHDRFRMCMGYRGNPPLIKN